MKSPADETTLVPWDCSERALCHCELCWRPLVQFHDWGTNFTLVKVIVLNMKYRLCNYGQALSMCFFKEKRGRHYKRWKWKVYVLIKYSIHPSLFTYPFFFIFISNKILIVKALFDSKINSNKATSVKSASPEHKEKKITFSPIDLPSENSEALKIMLTIRTGVTSMWKVIRLLQNKQEVLNWTKTSAITIGILLEQDLVFF